MTDAKVAVQAAQTGVQADTKAAEKVKCAFCRCKSNEHNSHLRTCRCFVHHICPNRYRGCNFHNETGLAEHEKTCGFNIVDCEFCGRGIYTSEIAKHTVACKEERVYFHCAICQQYFEKRPEYIAHFVKCYEENDKSDYYVEHFGEEFVKNAVRKADKHPDTLVFGTYDYRHHMPRKYAFDNAKYLNAVDTVKVRYILNCLVDLIPDKLE